MWFVVSKLIEKLGKVRIDFISENIYLISTNIYTI